LRKQRKRIGIRSCASALLVIALATLALGISGCKKSEPVAQQPAKRYHLVGKIVSIDKDQASVMVDGQEIVGFMAAMTMPYSVRDTKLLTPLTPGDEITADVVVEDNNTYLENIVVTKKGDGKGPTGTSYPPKPGDKVPDFALINQDGKKIHLSSYQGNVLLVTFIYTRCP
jgi:protein SCO1/2